MPAQSPSDFVAAKRALLGRWTPPLERAEEAARALRLARRFIPDLPLNLIGVGVGEKVTGGRRTGKLCVKVLVARKYPLGRIPGRHRIPSAVHGMITDVEEVGYAKALPRRRRSAARPRATSGRRAAALDPRRRHRPVPGGVSVGLDRGAVPYLFAGTLGVVVSDRGRPAARLALSNNHVLADENRAPLGAGVVQPGSLDGGKEADRIGVLERFERLRFGNRPNSMDAAVASLGVGVESSAAILGLEAPRELAEPGLEMHVRKMGRTTGLTQGIVRAVRFDVTNVEYEEGMVRVDDVVVIEGERGKFSDAGDSGSAILDVDGRLVALLFAGSPRVTFAIPMPRIFRRLRLRLPPARSSAGRRPGSRSSRRRGSLRHRGSPRLAGAPRERK